MMNLYQRLLRQVAEITRSTLGNMVRPGIVNEVKGDKMRVQIGKDKDGQPVLSPWLNTSNHRGGARESRYYKKGQNVMLLSPAGDPRQAVILPYAPNIKNLWPDHYDGKDGKETYQLDDYREVSTKDGRTMWIQEPEQKQQQQGEAKKLPDYKSDADGTKAKMAMRMDASGGITHRVGKDNRVAAHSSGAKLKASKTFVVAQKDKVISKCTDGPNYWHGNPPKVNEPPVIEDAPVDPIPDDNEVMKQDQQQGGGSGG